MLTWWRSRQNGRTNKSSTLLHFIPPKVAKLFPKNRQKNENLLKIYWKIATEICKVTNETKYKSLPVFSSCKVNDLGEMYKRDMNTDKEKTKEIIEQLEKEELGKNLGIESESGRNLLSSVNKQISGNLFIYAISLQ